MQCWWLSVDHMKHSFEVLLLINFQLESFNQRFMLKISVDDLCASPQVIFANIWVLIDNRLDFETTNAYSILFGNFKAHYYVIEANTIEVRRRRRSKLSK